MAKTRSEKVLYAVTSACRAISPSEKLAHTGNDNYSVFPDKQGEPKEQTKEVDIRTKAGPSTPTDVESLGKRNPYRME